MESEECRHSHKEFNYQKDGSAEIVCVKCGAAFIEPAQYYHVKGVSFTEVNGSWPNVSGYVRHKEYPALLGITEGKYGNGWILVRYHGKPLPILPSIELVMGTERTSLYAINPLALQIVHGVEAINRRHNAEPGRSPQVSEH